MKILGYFLVTLFLMMYSALGSLFYLAVLGEDDTHPLLLVAFVIGMMNIMFTYINASLMDPGYCDIKIDSRGYDISRRVCLPCDVLKP